MRWHAIPLAALVVAFALGATIADWVPGPTAWVVWAICLALAGVLLALRCERTATIALVAAVAGLGVLRGAAPALPPHHLAARPLPARAHLEGRLAAEPIRWAPDRTRIVLDAERLIEAGETRPVAGRVQLTLYGEAPPLTDGQRVAGEFQLSRPRSFRNPGGFDYAAHLARQDIFVVGNARAERITAPSGEPSRWNVAAKRWADRAIQGGLPPVSGALLDGLLFGERVGLPPEIDDAFRRAGVYHILAVSGFNVALLAAAVFALLALLRVPRRASAIVAIPVVAGFALVVGTEASVLRAAVMAILLLAAVAVEREPNLLNSLALAALVILAARPGDLAEPGFQLSFGATLGIVLLARRLGAALAARGAPRWLADALAVSAAAQLAVSPIMLHHFNQFSLIGVLANLLVVPLAGVATLVGMLAVLAAAISGVVSRALFDGLWPVLLALRAVVFLAARVPAGMLHLPAPHWAATAAFYSGIAAFLFSRPAAETRWNRRLAAAGIVMITAAVAVEVWPIARPADGRLRVTFLDVGQGDAIVLELPDGETALVDAGLGGRPKFDIGERVVAPFLWNRGVRRLAIAVATHDDADHAGGLAAILRLFPVVEVWRWDMPPADRVRLLGGAGVMVLNPPVPPLAGSRRGLAADRNNNSLVLRLDFGLVSLLLTGDIEAEAERHLTAAHAPLRARVLKVAHHGARSSTGAAFLGAVRPAVAVISVGARNPFGHPARQTLERLRTAGVEVYRTDEDGAVIVETDGRELRITRWADRATRRVQTGPS